MLKLIEKIIETRLNKLRHILKGCTYELHEKCPIPDYENLDEFKCIGCPRTQIRKHIDKYGYKTR